MSCNGNGNCGGACCAYPFRFQRRWVRAHQNVGQLGQFPTLPTNFGQPCTMPDGSYGWQATPGGPCEPLAIPGQLPPLPGQQPSPQPNVPGVSWCTMPDGSVGFQLPDGTCVPAVVPQPGQQPPPGVPDPFPGQYPGGELPSGVVTEQQCQAREQAARKAEESNLIKTAAITAVVSGVVGIVLGRVF